MIGDEKITSKESGQQFTGVAGDEEEVMQRAVRNLQNLAGVSAVEGGEGMGGDSFHEEMKKFEKPREKVDVVVRQYHGSAEKAGTIFKKDAIEMAGSGYYPTTQNFCPGSYGAVAFVIAVLLCFVFVGFLVFLYMLVVKPAGVLTVTYEKRLADRGAGGGGRGEA
jgi:hypothetical protein